MPSPTTFFVPFSFSSAVRGFQEPKSASDTPTGTPTGQPQQGATGASQPQGQPAAAPGFFDSALFPILMVMFAFILFSSMRKDGKARKAQQAMLAAIKQGDRCVTTGGMHGLVHKLDEKTVTLRFDGTTITFDRAAIARVERDGVAAPEAKKA